jgi:hypothetical protein
VALSFDYHLFGLAERTYQAGDEWSVPECVDGDADSLVDLG